MRQGADCDIDMAAAADAVATVLCAALRLVTRLKPNQKVFYFRVNSYSQLNYIANSKSAPM